MSNYLAHILDRSSRSRPSVADDAESVLAKESAFGPVEAPPKSELNEIHPLSDNELGMAIAEKSKLDSEDPQKEIYPEALRLGGSAWVPSTYWDADYRRRLGDAAQELQDKRPLRDREDTQADVRSGLMLDTVIFALEDPAQPR